MDFPSVLLFTTSIETKKTTAGQFRSFTVLIIPRVGFILVLLFLLVHLKLVKAFRAKGPADKWCDKLCRTACYNDDIDHSRAFPAKRHIRSPHTHPTPPTRASSPPPAAPSKPSMSNLDESLLSLIKTQPQPIHRRPRSLHTTWDDCCACVRAHMHVHASMCVFGHSILIEM